jgi:hypothetical protein
MWRLKLEWEESAWRLPLQTGSAATLVSALLEEPASCQQRLGDLLQTDAGLLLWVVCRAPDWRESPPSSAAGPAEWLHFAILNGLFEVEPDSHVPEQAGPNSAPRRAESGNWAADLLHGTAAQLAGPGASDVVLRECPWFPRWLHDPEVLLVEQPPARSDRVASASPGIEALASCLPRVLNRTRRLYLLESEFAAQLEREKLASLRQFAYGASHEINNPLANIVTRAQALLREESNPERKRKLSTIAAQAFRAHEMIADMMLFAKPPTPEFKSIDVRAIVGEAVRESLPDAQAQATQLVFEPGDPITASADPIQIGVAVKALVRNALEALVTGGEISITVRELPADRGGQFWLEISVQDSGPGLTPEARRHLFDPFYSGREAGRGLGFGLAKCWRIAELHAGEIRVASDVGLGATFTLRLPRNQVREPASA